MRDTSGFPVGVTDPSACVRAYRTRPDMLHIPSAAPFFGSVARGFVKNPLVDGVVLRTTSPHSRMNRGHSTFICATDGVGVAQASSGTPSAVMVTRDFGMSWRDVPAPTQEQNVIAHNNSGVWMMNSSAGSSGNTTLWSFNNGQRWVQKTGPFSGFQYAAGYQNGRFFVGQYNATQLYYTDDFGDTWKLSTLPALQHMRNFTGDGANTLLVTGEASTLLLYSRDNGTTWQQAAAATAGQFASRPPIYAQGKWWWACGNNQFVEYSEDLRTVRRVTLPIGGTVWNTIGYSPLGYFILSGNNSNVLMSMDGFQWTVTPKPGWATGVTQWLGTRFGFVAGQGIASDTTFLVDLT